MNVLLGAPIATVTLVAVVIILIYLYKTSELLNKRRLRFGIIITIIAAITINITLIIAMINGQFEIEHNGVKKNKINDVRTSAMSIRIHPKKALG